ncbi:hypothetical protein X727_08150 [Mesorhizobium sp. L103C119B0]|nr:hypothetical protein X727_08150 [Mesorhizobium sp. L103C119B0]
MGEIVSVLLVAVPPVFGVEGNRHLTMPAWPACEMLP